MVAKESTGSVSLCLVELGSHILVENVAEVLEEGVHGPNPITLEGAEHLAHVPLLVGRTGHHVEEFESAGA